MSSALSLGVSLKMYFTHRQTVAWAADVATLARTHPAILSGAVELFVAPSFVNLVPVSEILRGTRTRVAAQDVAAYERGPYTGEVSAEELREIGCEIVEIAHAERRRLFTDSDDAIADKVTIAVVHGLEPLICVGEESRGDLDLAAAEVIRQLEVFTSRISAEQAPSLLIAYEPVWAIGQPEPAPTEHIKGVIRSLAGWLADSRFTRSRVIYGGSAGPGLLSDLGADAQGLFLGRFAHDTANLARILDEAHELSLR